MKNERKRISRFRRLAGLDQLRLEQISSAMRTVRQRIVRLQQSRTELTGERNEQLSAYPQADPGLRHQAGLWLEWSIAEMKRLSGLELAADKELAELGEEYRRQKQRIQAWEKLIARMETKLGLLQEKRDLLQADEMLLISRFQEHARATATGAMPAGASDNH